MKKTFYSIACALFLGILNGNAQATQATNTVSNGNSYLGTSNNFDVLFKRQAIAAGLISTNKTSFGLNSSATPNSVSIGVTAGQYSTATTGYNTFIGQESGRGDSATFPNSGQYNTFVGFGSGANNTTGSQNVVIGALSHGNFNGNNNVNIGFNSGYEEANGASNNVFIGTSAGFTESGSNKLVIGSGETSQLIWGDFALNQLKLNSKVGIGYNFGSYPTTAGGVNVSTYNLFVKGGILTEEIRVNAVANWADYVFKKDYNLKSLSEVEDYIKENGHLPNVPSAEQVKEDGISLSEMAKIQQEKIEELTLYIIELNKKLEAQEKRLNELGQKQ